MSTVALAEAFVVALAGVLGLPSDIPPDPEPVDLGGTAGWVVPALVAGSVIVVLAVAATIVLIRRRSR